MISVVTHGSLKAKPGATKFLQSLSLGFMKRESGIVRRCCVKQHEHTWATWVRWVSISYQCMLERLSSVIQLVNVGNTISETLRNTVKLPCRTLESWIQIHLAAALCYKKSGGQMAAALLPIPNLPWAYCVTSCFDRKPSSSASYRANVSFGSFALSRW